MFTVLLGLLLLAAAPPTSILGTPVLLVYPFAVNGGEVTKEAGSRLAVAIATQIANLGGVEVKPATPGVERSDYLEAARHESADYYIAGYVTPLGDGVSVVEQLVSTLTGIVVYSNTAQIRTFEDAAGQGDVLRDALLRHQTRNLGAYAAQPPPAASPSTRPAPGTAAQANLGRLFGRRQKSSAAAAAAPTVAPTAVAQATTPPSPAPAAAPPRPVTVAAATRGSAYAIVSIGGAADPDRRSFTGAAIRNDLMTYHRRAALLFPSRESACSEDRIGTVLGGNLTTRTHMLLGQAQTIATLEFLAYDCTGNVVYRQTFAHDAHGDWKSAIDAVVAHAVDAFLRGSGPNQRS